MCQREIILVDEAEDVEHSDLLVLVEQFLEVQELVVNPECTHWDTVIATDLPQSETVSDGDLEHSAWGRPQLVRTLPLQNFSMQDLHSREASKGFRTHENIRNVLYQIHYRNTFRP